MLSSMKRRILVVVAIALASAIGVLFGLQQYKNTTIEQRREHAHETIAFEIDRLTHAFANEPTSTRRKRGKRDFGPIKSGFLTDDLMDEDGVAPFGSIPFEARAETARQAKASGALIVRDVANVKGQPLVVGAYALPAGGGFVWAMTYVGPTADAERLRVIVLFLAFATALLVIASVHTLVVFQRGAKSLRSSLRALASDLSSEVARPRLEELGDIADGVKQLAIDLTAAEHDKQRLTKELAQKERLAALGRVAAGVAHEVRNPLAAMKLRADLALENPSLDPALANDLGDIAREIARLDRFVQDLLVVAGRRDATRVEKDLGVVARARASLMAPWAKTRGGVAIDVVGEARAAIEEDAIARALDNLLRNAVEASPASSVVTIEITQAGEESRVTVIDCGEGVADARREQLFEPFSTTKPDGTGLGLALSRAVAVAHGGTVTYARDAVDHRTRFTLTIRG